MKEKYNVKNYHNFISLPTEDERKPISIEEGVLNTLTATVKPLTLEQITYINLMCNAFKTGRIEFEEADKEELYEELGINESSVLTAQEILDIINNPTKEKLEKIVAIDNLNTIDLFRGIVTSMKNMDNEDVSNRVLRVVNKRRDEIYRKPTDKTNIVIKKTRTEKEREEAVVQKAIDIEKAIAETKATYEAEIKKLKAQVKRANTKKATETKTEEVKTEE